jgi:hypothetical protein
MTGENHILPTINERLHDDGRTVLRVSRELKEFLCDAPADDKEAQSLLDDCLTLERIGKWLSGTNVINLSGGISTR